MSQKLTEGSAELSFVERLIRISEENENFSLDDVKAETIDALTAVRNLSDRFLFIFLLCFAFQFLGIRYIGMVDIIFNTNASNASRMSRKSCGRTKRCLCI